MLKIILIAVISVFRSREQLVLENVALHHQLEALQRNAKRLGLKLDFPVQDVTRASLTQRLSCLTELEARAVGQLNRLVA
jgi:hypothetical protein